MSILFLMLWSSRIESVNTTKVLFELQQPDLFVRCSLNLVHSKALHFYLELIEGSKNVAFLNRLFGSFKALNNLTMTYTLKGCCCQFIYWPLVVLSRQMVASNIAAQSPSLCKSYLKKNVGCFVDSIGVCAQR